MKILLTANFSCCYPIWGLPNLRVIDVIFYHLNITIFRHIFSMYRYFFIVFTVVFSILFKLELLAFFIIDFGTLISLCSCYQVFFLVYWYFLFLYSRMLVMILVLHAFYYCYYYALSFNWSLDFQVLLDLALWF